jgi:hypothetical protein
MPATRVQPRDAVHAILAEAEGMGLGLSVVTCVSVVGGVSVYLVTSPHPTITQALDLWHRLDAPAPRAAPAVDVRSELPRLTGPIPALGVTALSITVQP